jgi:hypothetical protein
MKKSLKSLVALLLVLVMVGSLTACAVTLKGTYTHKDGLVESSFIFKDDNKVSVSAFGVEIEAGEYEIKDGEVNISYEILGIKAGLTKSFEKKGNSIFIDGVEFVKE